MKANFDNRDTNGSSRDPASRLRLAGTWVTAEVAQLLAPTYNLEHIIKPLAVALPDSQQPYRRSTKASPQKPTPASSASTTSEQHPNKRRKESSPLPVPESAPSPTTPSHVDLRTAVVPRRNGRSTVSPAPSSQSRASRAKPPSKRTIQRVTATATTTTITVVTNGKGPVRLATPAESDAPDDDNEIAEVPGPDMSADVAEQRELIAKLKAERELGKQVVDGDTSMDMEESDDGGSQLKRSREEAEKPLQFNFPDEAPPLAVARPIVTNSRLRLPRLEPQQKSAAWGAVWFAAGLAAAYVLPNANLSNMKI